jgi:hypothetical protein
MGAARLYLRGTHSERYVMLRIVATKSQRSCVSFVLRTHGSAIEGQNPHEPCLRCGGLNPRQKSSSHGISRVCCPARRFTCSEEKGDHVQRSRVLLVVYLPSGLTLRFERDDSRRLGILVSCLMNVGVLSSRRRFCLSCQQGWSEGQHVPANFWIVQQVCGGNAMESQSYLTHAEVAAWGSWNHLFCSRLSRMFPVKLYSSCDPDTKRITFPRRGITSIRINTYVYVPYLDPRD